MKKAILFIVFLFAAANSFAQSTVYVQSHTRSNGTVVSGHHRTAPDNTINNNWSTKGNVNPYTGKVGTQTRERQSTTVSNIYQTPVQINTITPRYKPPATTYPVLNTSSPQIIYKRF